MQYYSIEKFKVAILHLNRDWNNCILPRYIQYTLATLDLGLGSQTAETS